MPALAGSSNFATLYAVVDLHEQKLEVLILSTRQGFQSLLQLKPGLVYGFRKEY